MKSIYIWGTGHYAGHVYSSINKEECEVRGVVDSDPAKQGRQWKDGFMIYPPERLAEFEYDYVILSMLKYESAENDCKELGIPDGKVISYWKDAESAGIFKNRVLEILEEQRKVRVLENRLESAPYEWGLKTVPRIEPAEDLLKKIIRDGSSLCRFGDGEFDIMRGKDCSWFQKGSEDLKIRLMEVINSDNPCINIAIAQNFKDLGRYKEAAADEIRAYMSGGNRETVIKFLDLNRAYYDAYVTRPYIIYKDKINAECIFPLFKELWRRRTVVLVEGEYGRNGVNNDLFDSALEIRRIICPSKDAWTKYDEIKEAVLKVAETEDLICIALGPAAKILAYDLAKLGYQAIDIGQVDNEYDWYTAGVGERTAIEGKIVAEITVQSIDGDFHNERYVSQIAAIIR